MPFYKQIILAMVILFGVFYYINNTITRTTAIFSKPVRDPITGMFPEQGSQKGHWQGTGEKPKEESLRHLKELDKSHGQ